MPLLNKAPFERIEIRENLKDDDQVFYCSVTDEIFDNYEEFCERVLMVNSVVWTCSFTGKSNMTFEEAVASEEQARGILKDFPVELRIPALYLASLTQRTSLENLAEDVFSFIKERYFIGESVEVNFKGDVWNESHVIQVISGKQESGEGEERHNCGRFESASSDSYHYEVETYQDNASTEQVVTSSHIRRKKGLFTRDRNRLYLKQFVEPTPNGVWAVKAEALSKYGIPRVKFDQLFVGVPPVFQASKNMRKPQAIKPKGKKTKQESIERYLTVSNNQNKKRTPQKEMAQKVKDKYHNVSGVAKKYKQNNVMTIEKLQLLREQQKERALEARRKKQAEKLVEREKLKSEKLRLAEFMKSWNRQREDLECEDLKPLPTPIPVKNRIPNENFGDFLMILEFFHNFSDALNTKDFFPYGVTFDLVERALSEKEVAGPFSDMLQFLLTTLFKMQEEEDDEILDYNGATDMDVDESDDVTTSEAIRLATAAAGWSQQYQGTPLCKLALDSVTVTEVLRLHLLSSGGRCSDKNAKWRYQQRGGYCSRDDPGLLLRMQNPNILKALSVMTVFDLPLGDKLTVMTCLKNQILTYAALRDVIDDRCEKYRVLKIELKVLQLAIIKREKELTALRIKQRRDARLKQKGEPAVEGEETEAEVEEHIQKLEKEVIKRQNEMQRKNSDLNLVAMGHRVVPLGEDRAHRRFWVFNSCPGLFVEHDPCLIGPCLPEPTPLSTHADNGDTIAYVRKLFQEEKCNGGSDKENEAHDDGKRVKVRSRSEPMEEDEDTVLPQALVCTADDKCAVHSDLVKRTKWSFFSNEDEVKCLIECLNSRGVREGELRQNLLDENQKIVQAMKKCVVHKLNSTLAGESPPEEKKSSRSTYNARYVDANLSFPADTSAEQIFELTLRDLIIDLEEKIHCGGLGALKVFDRLAWRTALNNSSYDKQCNQLSWGVPSEQSENIPNAKATSTRGRERATPAVEAMEHDGVTVNPVVNHLAMAVLQLGQSLEKKYRQKPLAPDDDDWSPIERWENSLMSSTGWSQLFVHYYTLESSIQWSKSALNANCRLCRRRGDAENMLLCDSCNKGHHMYCLKPKLTKVPKGDWFCPKCRPEEKTPRADRKRRTIFLAEEEEEEEEEVVEEKPSDLPVDGMFIEVCDACGEGGHVICCDTESCALVYHIECLVPPLKKVPRGKWFCPKCKQQPPLKQSHENSRQSKDGDTEWQSKEDLPVTNRNRRNCATAAVAKISQFAKRIRSRSWDNDSGSTHSDEFQPSRRSARMSLEPDLDLPLNNAVLQDLLTEVMHHKDAWPFLRPVPRAQVPDYHLIIKRPMDLGTMKNKLNMLKYTNNSEFIADANLVFENCKMYNHYDALEYKAGVGLRGFFKERCKDFGLELAATSAVVDGDSEEDDDDL